MTIELQKQRVEKVGIILEKKGVTKAPTMQVCLAIDISGSMGDEFADGSVQHAFDQLMAVAEKFDDNGEMEVWGFDNTSKQAPTATTKDIGTYIGSRQRLGKFGMWPRGGTSYAPVLRDITESMTTKSPSSSGGGLLGMFAKKPATPAGGIPTMVLFITDGEPDDANRAAQVIEQSRDRSIYYQLIGVGNDCKFNTLKMLADRYDNCGFVQMTNVRMSDDQLYEQLITDELIQFVKKFQPVTATP